MKHLRNKRGLAGLGALAAVIGVTLWVVLPALASTPGDGVPPASADGVMPVDVGVGGNPADKVCQAMIGPNYTGPAYQIKNPTPGTYTTHVNGTLVKFILSDPGNVSGKTPAYGSGDTYLNFTAIGAQVVDVGINGGQDTTDYKYSPASSGTFPILNSDGSTSTSPFANNDLGFVTWDNYLHAPAQSIAADGTGSPSQLYSLSHVTFCFNLGGSTASGTVFDDVNHNGTKDATESGVSQTATVKLYSYSSGSLLQTTTTTTGSYTFSNLPQPGTYTVCVAGLSDWKQTAPTSGGDCGTGNPPGLTFSAGSTAASNLNFGLAQIASISGHAVTTDGTTTTDAPGLQATLYDNGTALTPQATTNSSGMYTFPNVYAGYSGDQYTVCIASPGSTYTETSPTSGADCTFVSSSEAPIGHGPFTLGTGGQSGLDFTFHSYVTVSGNVYEDLNQNGSYDSSGSSPDTPLNNWTVNLYKSDGAGNWTSVGTSTSGTDGHYSFSVPADGSTYRVCEVAGTSPPQSEQAWTESEPYSTATSPNMTSCSGKLARGYSFTASSSQTDDNFGNVVGLTCPPTSGTIGPADYQIGSCKAGETYVFNSGTIPTTASQYAGAPYVTYGLGTPTSTTQATIEYVKVADSFTSDPNQPDHKSLYYTNDPTFPAPADPSNLNWHLMPYCNRDPRGTTAATPFDLPSGVNPGDVIPGYNNDNSIDACVISITTSRPTTGDGSGTLEAYVYALDDAGRMAF